MSAEGSPEKDDIGHDTAVHDVHVTVGGVTSVSWAAGAAGIHHIDTVGIGAHGTVGVSKEGDVTVIFFCHLHQLFCAVVHAVFMTVCEKDLVLERYTQRCKKRCATAEVVVAPDTEKP